MATIPPILLSSDKILVVLFKRNASHIFYKTFVNQHFQYFLFLEKLIIIEIKFNRLLSHVDQNLIMSCLPTVDTGEFNFGLRLLICVMWCGMCCVCAVSNNV